MGTILAGLVWLLKVLERNSPLASSFSCCAMGKHESWVSWAGSVPHALES